ncbi:MAG: ABC transporter permease [Clostridia bacterium]|nr:ABC transporter permease [Clostridia bacterium]
MKHINWSDFIKRNIALLAVVMMLIVGTVLYGNTFLNYRRNLMNVLFSASMLGIMGIGVNLCFLIGARDLSVAAVAAAASMFSAFASPYGLAASLAVGLICGALFGCLSGVVVAKFKVQPFIATLGVQLAARGTALLVNNELSKEIDTSAHLLKAMGNANLFGLLPVSAAIFICLIVVFTIVLGYTSFGRAVYAIGGNEEAAAMMGVSVDKVKILIFMMSGMTAGLTGVILSGHISAGQPTSFVGWEMTIMAAIVIGGTSTTGGVGKIYGIFFGVLFLQLITNIINLNGTISPYWKDVITGGILLGAVLLQRITDIRSEMAATMVEPSGDMAK